MKTKTIRQTISIPAPPDDVYATLMSGGNLSKMHGSKATMSKKVNGKFSVFNGYCHGINLRLEPGHLIGQLWHFREEGWPEDYFSTCLFILTPTISGTKLVFDHKGVPERNYEDIKRGWKLYYWEPLIACLSDS